MTDRSHLEITMLASANHLEQEVYRFLSGRKLKGAEGLRFAAKAYGEARQALAEHVRGLVEAPEDPAPAPFEITPAEDAPGFEVME